MTSRSSGAPTPRRALSGVAILALAGATFAPLGASATDDSRVAPGSPAPESKIQDNQVVGAEVVPNSYLVELAGPTTTEGGSLSAIESSRAQFLADAEAAGAEVEVTSEFDALWNGVTVTADDGTLLDLAASEEVVAIFPVGVIDEPERPQTTEIEPEMFTAISMTGADIVQSELGYTGEGIRIGIIDTGVDYDHPDFGGNGSPNSTTFPTEKVGFGYDFVGDSYNASPSAGDAYQPQPMPDADPDDCNGHGTHVAGISAADGVVTGVAPEATIGAYRVFGCGGSTTAEIMLHAMELTLEDEMDVVNLSIGSAFSAWKEYPTAQATDALAREGVVVVASIGNSGAAGLHSAGAPGVGEDTIGVGSVDNIGYRANMFTDEIGEPIPYGEATGAPAAPTSGSEELVPVGAPDTPEGWACSALPTDVAAAVEGNVALIQRGECSFYEKAINAMDAGATGVVLYNNAAGAFSPTVAGTPPVTIPVVAITGADGLSLYEDAGAGSGTTTMTWTDEQVNAPSPTGGLMSSFSSFGTMADTTFKPDLSAPGGQIYAPYPLEIQDYATLSGTSMSAPHVAGAAALLLEAEPELSVEDVKLRLQNTSTQLPLNIAPTAGLEVVHRQGSGMIQIDDAILADVLIEPGLVQLGQQLSGETSTPSVTIYNYTDEVQTYTTEHVPAVATSGTANDWGYYLAGADVVVQDVVEVPAGGSVDVPMTITSPTIEDEMGPIYGGYVTFTSGEGELAESYSVSYGGYAHDLQQVEVLADMVDAEGNTTQELPALAVVDECEIWLGYDCVDTAGSYTVVDDYVYSMDQDDAPQFLIHFEHQARKMEWELFEATADGAKGESLGTVSAVDYLARSETRNGFSAFPWDGKYVNSDGARATVDNGDYIMEIVVTKASAWNDDREPMTETYTSQAFGIEFTGQGPEVIRTSGHNRYATASELALAEYPDGADTVFVANGENFPDALAGGALAGALDAPVLLTEQDGLPSATRMALQTLAPEQIIVLGGEAAVSLEAMSELGEYADVERMSGGNRYGTAAQVSSQYDSSDMVFLASGDEFPDALAAAAAAGMEEAPILLTRPGGLPGPTVAELERLSPETIYVIGGDAAISDVAEQEAEDYADEVVRLGGTNRYSTAGLVAREFFPSPAPGAFVATGMDFPDALSAAPIAGSNNSPVLLTRPDRLPGGTTNALMALRAQNVTIVGGFGAVNLAVQEALEAINYP